MPLKDWDIQINYGIKTGCNEAFIVTTAKRDEILANCSSKEERERTEQLIRPILRGRDIKRYGYDWADLWLINTHNGIKGSLPRVDIKDYPAVKAHLDEYWLQIEKRADKGDTPYNLRNCAYLEEFEKPKIVFQEIVDTGKFALDAAANFLCLDTCRIITGKHLKYLLYILNSKLFSYAVKKFYGGGGLSDHGIRMKHTFFMQFHCTYPDDNFEQLETLSLKEDSDGFSVVDSLIYKKYALSKDEIECIESEMSLRNGSNG